MLTKKNPAKYEKNCKDSKSSSQATLAVEKLLKSSLNEKTQPNNCNTKSNVTIKKKPECKSCIVIKFDVGFANELYIRGEGANLSWNKGQKMKNISPDEWSWEIDGSFGCCEFKVLLNDKQYEAGENQCLKEGENICYTPNFSK